MNDEDRIKAEGDFLFSCLDRLYGQRLGLDRQTKLRGGIETVAKTLVALRSVPLSHYGDPSLPFTPFRKAD